MQVRGMMMNAMMGCLMSFLLSSPARGRGRPCARRCPGSILNLIGASTVTLLTFIFPPLFYMRLVDASTTNKEWTPRLDICIDINYLA